MPPRVAPVCSIIPPAILKHIINHAETSDATRAAVQKTYNHICKLNAARQSGEGIPTASAPQGITHHGQSSAHHPPGRRGIIPPQIFQAMRDSQETSSAQKEHAEKNLQAVSNIHSTRTDQPAAGGSTTAHVVYRELYDSEKTSSINKHLLFKEGALATKMTDSDAKNVYQYFGDTFQFYSEVFKRNSVDDKGLHLKGNVHYDDEPGPPGMDNAFWDGNEMAFGDGDGDIFGSFTKNIDVIGHELTHGVTQYTAELEYEYQSGALNESISDVFGTMIKQYFGGPNGTKQKAVDADWLIGAGIFLPSVSNAKALRSMKSPGTAYDNAKIGKDTQPATMDGYVDLPNTGDGDQGGVHTNSGIPNHAFYLAATSLGGYSWEKAGPVWYAALTDPKIKGIDTKTAFKAFADLTVSHAGSMFDTDTQAKIKQAWIDVKVLAASSGDGEL